MVNTNSDFYEKVFQNLLDRVENIRYPMYSGSGDPYPRWNFNGVRLYKKTYDFELNIIRDSGETIFGDVVIDFDGNISVYARYEAPMTYEFTMKVLEMFKIAAKLSTWLMVRKAKITNGE